MIILYKVPGVHAWYVRVGEGCAVPGVYTDTKANALRIVEKNFVLTVPTLSAENFLKRTRSTC